MSSFRHLVLILVLASTAACGFQARGRAEFSPGLGATYIQTSDRHSPFYRELVKTLRSSEIALVDSAAAADTVVLVNRDSTGQRVLSVSLRNVPDAYEVFYTIAYEVIVNGQRVLEPQLLTRTREYTYDETEVLGKALEESMLRKSLAEDLVGLVIRRISTVK